MRESFRLTGLSISCFTAAALGSEYFLRPGETVSNLLFNRLNIKPIYSKNGVLEQVLKSNGLTLEKAKKLPVGYPIFITGDKSPSEDSPKEQIKTISEPIPEETLNLPEPILNELPTRYVILDGSLNYFSFKGEGSNGNINGATVYPKVGANFIHYSSKYIFKAGTHLAVYYFIDDSANRGKTGFILPSFEGNALKRIGPVNIGLMASYKSHIFFKSYNDATYELKSPWFYSLGPQIEWQYQSNLLGFKYQYLPTQNLGSNQKAKANTSYNLNYSRIISQELRLGLEGELGDRNTNLNDTSYLNIGINLNYTF